MGQHARIELPPAEQPPAERFGVLVGWKHSPCGEGLNLHLQSAQSQAALRQGAIDSSNLLMTRNQALLLARYLLAATGQLDEVAERPHGWRSTWSRIRGR